MPVTLQPRPAKYRAFGPVPQPASRKERLCALPMSQGDWPASEALSNVLRSGPAVLASILLGGIVAKSGFIRRGSWPATADPVGNPALR
jgi:hypothetical protein